jgi:hypothetical protein
MFRIPNIEPDGTLSVTEEFNATIVALARQILPSFKE